MTTHENIPKNLYKNKCPIVLVHGFMGVTSDESVFFNYFGYNFDPEVVGDLEVYETDMSPTGSVHDRAC